MQNRRPSGRAHIGPYAGYSWADLEYYEPDTLIMTATPILMVSQVAFSSATISWSTTSF